MQDEYDIRQALKKLEQEFEMAYDDVKAELFKVIKVQQPSLSVTMKSYDCNLCKQDHCPFDHGGHQFYEMIFDDVSPPHMGRRGRDLDHCMKCNKPLQSNKGRES